MSDFENELDLIDDEEMEAGEDNQYVDNLFIQDNVNDTIRREQLNEDDEADIDEDGNLVYKKGKEKEESQEDEPEDDLVESILKSKGIDPRAIKIEEDGEIKEYDWNDLSVEDQKGILFPEDEDETVDDYGLDNEETDLINQIREYNLTPRLFIDNIKQIAIQEYLNQNSTSEVDSYSDDEVFLADLKQRYADITDEEAAQALELEKSNPDLYAKKIASMRAYYKQVEENNRQAATKEQEEAQKQAYAEYENQIINTIKDMNQEIDLGLHTLKWDTQDMEDIASFILDSDPKGNRYISQALSDPKTLVQMAWFAIKGQDAINSITSYYKAQIKEVSKTNYEQGYEDAKKGNKKSEIKSVVRKPTKNNNKKESLDGSEVYDLDDLDF